MRESTMRRILLLVFAFALSACTGDDRPGDASGDDACDAVEACEGANGRAQCEELFDLVVASSACTEAIHSATCEAHARQEPPYLDVCMPPCDGSEPACNENDTITRCLPVNGESRLATVRCPAACAAQGLSYAGVCGRAYEAQTSTEDECWCRDDASQSPAPDALVVDESDAVDPSLVCQPLFECVEHCTYDIDQVLLTAECVAAIEAASCEDHALEIRPYEDAVCFPRCDTPTIQCNESGTVTACEARADGVLRWRTYSCRGICESYEEIFVECDSDLANGDPRAACQCEEP